MKDNRFYPDYYEVQEHEPTRDRFVIKQHKIYGDYVESKVAFEKGDTAFQFQGPILPAVTLYTLEIAYNMHLQDVYFMGYVMHSCNPNCFVDMQTRQFLVIKPIKAGEPITMDYMQTETKLHRGFQCSCGAEKCRLTL